MTTRELRAFMAAGLMVCAAARADTLVLLPDPTRPPNSVRAALSGGGNAMSPAAQPAPMPPLPGEPKAVALPPVRRLTSIRLDESGGGWALIDGQVVGIGERLGDATVVSMDSETVVLRGAQGQHKLLTLTPTVNKTAPGAVTAAVRSAKER
ncbi:MAG: hypothetical protein EOP40_11245 [Rubrivivax sp.]|nr:MAG: hypothetical protein EOP40_11245 [Rubrivivax sp.]